MALLNTRFRLSVDLWGFLFWCLIALIFPIIYHTIEVVYVLKGFLFLLASTCTGTIVLGNLPFINRIPSFLRTGFLMMAGTYLLYFILALLPYTAVFYVILAAGLFLFAVMGKVERSLDLPGLATVLPVCMLLIFTTDVRLAASPVFVDVPGDYFFYNVLVVSLSKNLSIWNSLFHTGIPINYQSLTFFSPAALSFATGIPPHVALHGIFSPLLKVMSFSMLAASLVYVCAYVKGDGRNAAWSWKYYAAASIALLLIAPLHPLYLLKLDFKNVILLGEGYLLPTGVMGFALSILFFGVLNFFFFSDEKKTYAEIVCFVLLLSFITATKTAMFVPLMAFYGLYALIRLVRDKKDRRIVYIFLAAVAGAVVMKVFFGNSGGMIRTSFTLHEGYFQAHFREGLEKFHRSATTVSLALFFGVMLVLWMGLKTVLFSGVLLSRQPFLTRAWPIIVAALGSVAVAFLPGFLLKMTMVDERGVVLQDNTFDSGQFSRAGLFISTAMAAMSLLLLWGTQTGIRKRLFQTVVVAWFVVAFAGFYKGLRETPGQSDSNVKWEEQVEADFHREHPQLMAMLSDYNCSGQTLMAYEVYPWWTCCKRGADRGYVCTLKSNYRNVMLEQLLGDSVSRTARAELLGKIRAEGVDAFVSTPANRMKFERLVNDSLLTKPDNSIWIYKIK